MTALRLVSVTLAAVLCLLLGAARGAGGPGVVVAAADTRVALPEAAGDGVEPAFLAHMTADDVARGVYGLAEVDGAVALTADQRARIRPMLEEGAALRARLGALRAERRAARDAWVAGGATLAATLGPDRARAAAQVAP